SGATTGTTVVSYFVTGSGTFSASPSDFVGGAIPSGTVTFNPGDTAQTITIPVNGDTTTENDETFTVNLFGANPNNIQLSPSSAVGTILNDDAASLPSLAIAPGVAARPEGNSGTTPFTFTVTRTGNTSGTTTVSYAVTGDSSFGPAANAADF